MQINLNPRYNVSFKQILLSRPEYNDGKKLFDELVYDNSISGNKDLLFDIFEPHLNKEVELKDFKNADNRKYFSKNLYLKFFKILNAAVAHNGDIGDFIHRLNIYCHNFVENFDPNETISMTNYNVSNVENLVEDFYTYLGMSKEAFLVKNQKFPVLQNKSLDLLKDDVKYVVENLGFTEEEYLSALSKNFLAILSTGDSIVEKAKETTEILKVKDLEEFRLLVSMNPALLTPYNLKDKLNAIAEFLDVDEEKIIDSVKDFSLLATYKLDEIKSNFYAMKDYLKVDRDKMVEISLLNSGMLTCDFEKNKHKYEDLANIFDLSTDSYIRRANEATTIHLITPKKLEKYFDYISKQLGYSREETIDYVKKNFNLLSYKFENIVQRTADNYTVLKEEFGIDYDTYRKILEKNSWIMGSKNGLIKQNIIDACEYFNIDKDTYAKMAIEYPRLLTAYISSLDKNIGDLAEILGLTKEEYKQICLKDPKMAMRIPHLFREDVENNANLLDLSMKDFGRLAQKNPVLITKRYDTLDELTELIQKKNNR